AVASANLDFPTGRIKNEDEQVVIRLAGKFETVEEIGELAVTYNADGMPVRVMGIAEVLDSNKDEEIIRRLNGNSAIALTIQKQSDANAVDVASKVETVLAELQEAYKSSNLRFEVSQDSSEFTLKAANDVIFDLVLAVILVAFIMLLFLHS